MIAINKPNGLLVHKTVIAKDAKVFALQELRNQIGAHVYTVHRLDRKTSGVLLFALSKEAQAHYAASFRLRKVHKKYHAIVRGYISDMHIDYALKNAKGVLQEAVTDVKLLEYYEIILPSNGFETSRYSLVELTPKTGRMHQLRKHMAHVFHPIIGDRPHGCNKQNKLWKSVIGNDKMFLHATSIDIDAYNRSGERIMIHAPYALPFQNAKEYLSKNNLYKIN